MTAQWIYIIYGTIFELCVTICIGDWTSPVKTASTPLTTLSSLTHLATLDRWGLSSLPELLAPVALKEAGAGDYHLRKFLSVSTIVRRQQPHMCLIIIFTLTLTPTAMLGQVVEGLHSSGRLLIQRHSRKRSWNSTNACRSPCVVNIYSS